VGGLSPGLVGHLWPGGATAFRADLVRSAIGCVISVLLLWRGLRLPPGPSRGLAFAVGLVVGVMSGLASMGGPPIVVYLLALSHEAAVVRASSIVYFMLSAIVSLLLMSLNGLIVVPSCYGRSPRCRCCWRKLCGQLGLPPFAPASPQAYRNGPAVGSGGPADRPWSRWLVDRSFLMLTRHPAARSRSA
jgi:hypothetical protein